MRGTTAFAVPFSDVDEVPPFTPRMEHLVTLLRERPREAKGLRAELQCGRQSLNNDIQALTRWRGFIIDSVRCPSGSYYVLVREPGVARFCPDCGKLMSKYNPHQFCEACIGRRRTAGEAEHVGLPDETCPFDEGGLGYLIWHSLLDTGQARRDPMTNSRTFAEVIRRVKYHLRANGKDVIHRGDHYELVNGYDPLAHG
jgi:biotin operon repressor